MRHKHIVNLSKLALGVGVLLPGLASLSPAGTQAAQATPFADPAFQRTWTRTDAAVANGSVKRSWYWGPQPNSGAVYEDYAQGPNGKHLVQYFDKSRMEINNPGGDPNNPFYVTNGLLTVELITGRMQTGDNSFALRWPANIPLASDTDDPYAPTYASFRGAIVREDADATGKVVIAQIQSNGTLDFVHGGNGYGNLDKYNVKNAHYEPATKHNIPDVFWQFLNQTGPVTVSGKTVTARLSDPYFYVTGYPISDPYWASAKIEGKAGTPVLIQAYQRRVLTYVPSAPEGFKVQMGNIGQHYYDWRYKDAGKPKVLTGGCQTGSVMLGFGKVYSDNPEIKFILGCPTANETRATVTQQAFERGMIIGVVKYNYYSGQYYEEVFAMSNDGKVQDFYYLPINNKATPLPVSAQLGGTVSTANFVSAWQNASVRDSLGNPTSNANVQIVSQGTPGVPQPNPTGGVPVQSFDGGFMVYPDLAAKKIYVLYNTTGAAADVRSPHITYTAVDRWSVFNDTYQP